jgi:hypothetical protein
LRPRGSRGSSRGTARFPNGRAEILHVGGGEVGRLVFEPGWRWSEHVKPGTELIAGPGDITSLPSGHDAWVVGDEPAAVVDWYGASNYAKGA